MVFGLSESTKNLEAFLNRKFEYSIYTDGGWKFDTICQPRSDLEEFDFRSHGNVRLPGIPRFQINRSRIVAISSKLIEEPKESHEKS